MDDIQFLASHKNDIERKGISTRRIASRNAVTMGNEAVEQYGHGAQRDGSIYRSESNQAHGIIV